MKPLRKIGVRYNGEEDIVIPSSEAKKRWDRAPVITLTEKEWLDAFCIGVERTISYNEHGGDTPIGKNNKFETFLKGSNGEMMVSVSRDWDIDREIYFGGETGHDFHEGGLSIELKASTRSRPYLFVKETRPIADQYILIHLFSDEAFMRGKVIGVVDGEKVAAQTPVDFPRNKERGCKNRCLHWLEMEEPKRDRWVSR